MVVASRRVPFIAANWKMHLTRAGARELARKVAAAGPELRASTVVLIPPFTALGAVEESIAGTEVGLGAQDLYWEEQGAFTGEVSAPMLKDAGCAFVLIGHSERRRLFGETDESVGRKAGAALRAGLSPIVCVGEVLEEREAGRTMARIDDQLALGLSGLSRGEMERIIIAYEPVWAIGTGRTATPAQAGEVHAHIRKRVEDGYGNRTASCAIILYGGSVKPANAYPLFQEKDIDGFLVGGASLDADGFVGIVREAIRAAREEKEK
jgi:triosephosphate isomerase